MRSESHQSFLDLISKTNEVVFILKSLDGDLTERNSAIAASIYNRFVANEDDQFECYGIFYLNKWTENETEVKKTIRQTVENYSKNIQKGQDQPIMTIASLHWNNGRRLWKISDSNIWLEHQK